MSVLSRVTGPATAAASVLSVSKPVRLGVVTSNNPFNSLQGNQNMQKIKTQVKYICIDHALQIFLLAVQYSLPSVPTFPRHRKRQKQTSHQTDIIKLDHLFAAHQSTGTRWNHVVSTKL